MKRITRFGLYLLVAIPAALFASNTDTTSNTATSKSLTLRGNLSSFNAAYGRNYFELNWSTVAGTFDHFVIERSLDGEKFESIGTVDNRKSATEGSFIFRDHFRTTTALNNDFFYRLKQVEADGNIVYSKVLVARMFNTRSLASLSITPDPLANDILVNVQLNANSYVVMKVSDEKGNLLIKEGQKAAFGANSYSLQGTNKLQPGLYTLEITVNSREKMIMKLSKG